ncbi:enoyl-CoA hydratase/isomerase family protein [Tistrella mobilis]|uniref:enoyl-CoA hydratase/isomerase family protein n=1 Tax=Tistrella mobilis TaxID=171437 RepID=UPI003555D6F9
MSSIELEFRGGLAEIVLNRPGRKNALRREDWNALRQAIDSVATSDARALLVRGAGGDFCAGFDLGDVRPETTDAFAEIDQRVNPALRALRDLPVPTIAAAEGVCVGGGLGIAAACDLLVTSDTARLGAPYAAIGFLCDAGLHVFLRDTLGYQRAAWLIFTGRLLTAPEAMAFGLSCAVLPAEGFVEKARALAQEVAAGPTSAFRFSKRIMRTAADPDAGLDAEALFQAQIFSGEDAAEGVEAFLGGRRPRFVGR